MQTPGSVAASLDASPVPALLIAAESGREQFLREALEGLAATPKTLPCKYFYDEAGSRLFDAICDLPEYYPTRTELSIMETRIDDIVAAISPCDALIELGSGSSLKTRLLLDKLATLGVYVPVDISADYLATVAAGLRAAYPGLQVAPVAADYTHAISLPPAARQGRAVVYFPGSTIGNFHLAEALAFLRRIRVLCGDGGGLLIGVDLHKEAEVLHAAYNDAAGVTAEFNRNLLRRLQAELDADLALEQFSHRAVYNQDERRIEMHLVSNAAQCVRLGGETIWFGRGETVWTECSYKHTLPGFAALAAQAGFDVEQVWTDEQDWFSVQWLRAR